MKILKRIENSRLVDLFVGFSHRQSRSAAVGYDGQSGIGIFKACRKSAGQHNYLVGNKLLGSRGHIRRRKALALQIGSQSLSRFIRTGYDKN